MSRRSGFRTGDVPGASYDEARRERESARRGKNLAGGEGRGDAGLVRVLFVLGIVAAVVVARLLWLQVLTAGSLAQEAETQRTNAVTLHAKRGTIYDRNGNVLATSEECQTIYANPEEINDPNGTAELLADVLGGDKKDYYKLLRTDGTFVYLKRQVDNDACEKLRTEFNERGIRGVYFLSDTRRVYPYGAIAGQVLGVVGVDGDGLSGLELYYNDILKGTDGQMIMEVGQGGTPIAGAASDVTLAKDGTDIIISLDIDIQSAAEEQIVAGIERYGADSGSVVVTNPQNGEILAMCSTPLLDPTDTASADEAAFTLKPVTSSYEPGSIFKVLTASIGIENGLMSPNSSWVVPGKVQVGDDLVGDADGRTETVVYTLRDIIAYSSNAGIAMAAQDDIGAKRFSEGVAAYQIGQATGIDYPGEGAGIVKTLDQYDGSTLGNMSFGQGVAVPMVQMIKAIGSIANGGTLYTPHFLMVKGGKEVSWEATGTTMSAETCSAVTDMMRSVVAYGTGIDVEVDGYDVAVKTGTGEQVNENGSGYLAGKYVSSMIGFANASDPQVLVYVGLNGTAYHGNVAAGMFSAIMSEALSDTGVTPAG